jgi:TMEM175 potassium channel family protein
MTAENPNARLEAFCDGVFAIALTLLIIDIRVPPPERIHDTGDLWLALGHLLPSIVAFLLSFAVILITWVNHHATLKLVSTSSSSFIYANGLLLLTVVFVPFPTALLGAYVLTDHAAPAVCLYDAVLALQAVAWILLSRTALANGLTRNDKATAAIRAAGRFGYMALLLYSLCAVVALWYPLTIAVITVIIWIFWLVYGINIKPE